MQVQVQGLRVANTNKLLFKSLRYRGLKTGITQSAKGCLSLLYEDDLVQLLAVVLGSNDQFDRFADSERIVKWALKQ